MSGLYISRTLLCEDKTLTEAKLLRHEGVVVVLAEPGAGKTRLLSSISSQLGVVAEKASIFKLKTSVPATNALVLDALDEIAKLDSSGIDAVLVKAQETGANKVVLASRSSEWEKARSVFIGECFGTDPMVVRLQPFNDTEQKELFLDYVPREDFSEFKRELERFELQPLLGNPQFLKLFADAFVQSGRKFTTKSKIFEDAVLRLAHEANSAVSQTNRPPVDTLIKWANEVFAKLLLSGAAGVSFADNLDEKQFPHLRLLVLEQNAEARFITDTRLLKPSAREGEHEPVHRIVAEYCAARYLAKRIDDSADRLSLRKCLAIIAPNSVVRDELRGLLGWMAAVGSKNLQEAAIDLDPYAVLANGDPSQLWPSSKRKLLSRLKDVAEDNPYFRRGDIGRTFSTSGFFSAGDVEYLKPQLVGINENRHLRDLLLELLNGSDAVPLLVSELHTLMLDPDNSLNTRELAHWNLIDVAGHDHKSDCEELFREGSPDALYIAAVTFQELGVEALGHNTLLNLLHKCTELYPGRKKRKEHTNVAKFFIKKLIRELELFHIEWLLDQLTEDLTCTCGEKAHNCDCRTGISKVVGLLLDRYFEKSAGPFDPVRVWQWLRNLNFHYQVSPQQSESVRVLQTNHELRQGIQRHALEGVTDPDEVWNIWLYTFTWQSHAGLRFQLDDNQAMVDHAFENDNPALWTKFCMSHNPYENGHGPDTLRTHMRRQANQKPEFMRAWSKWNNDCERDSRQFRKSGYRHSRRAKRRKNREDQIKSANLQHLRDNRDLVESGRHWKWLEHFAELYLMNPEKLSEHVDDPEMPINALCICLPFIESELPTLERLAELNCNSQFLVTETILFAACLAIFRRYGSLASIKQNTLAVLKTNIDMTYEAVEEGDRSRFEAEVNSRLFQTKTDVEQFARQYLEPQLRIDNCKHTEVSWLRNKPEFSPLLEQLPLEWLTRFSEASIEALDTLFDLGAEHSDQTALLELIKLRYVENFSCQPDETENKDLEARRSFWFLRHFFFAQDCPEAIERWFKSDPNTIFALERRAGPFSRSKNKGWPTLSAENVYMILDAFVETWPKVHLPSGWGTGSPKNETAYRFLTHIVWTIKQDDPDNSLPTLNSIIADERFGEFHNAARDMRASTLRQLALRDFEAPAPSQVVEVLDRNQAATVEVLRAQLLEELEEFQRAINGSEFDPIEKFYSGDKRVDEPRATKRIAEHLQMRLNSLNIAVPIEHHFKDATRCDITATIMLDGAKKLLPIEVKGQWNPELFTAAEKQLHQKYSVHPNAEQQGIYLVLWFGGDEKIAGKGEPSINSPIELKEQIIAKMPVNLRGLIDVFVLDLSRK